MSSNLKKIDDLAKQILLKDRGLNNFLKSDFPVISDRRNFVKKCLKKLKTRRMLLRAQWYLEIADDQVKVRQNRPALQLIFLMALAEAIAKQRIGNPHLSSLVAVKKFFNYISPSDKGMLNQSFRRALLQSKHHRLRFSSVLRILYEVRNSAVHGEDYFSFSLMDKNQKVAARASGYTSYSLLTYGYLVPRKRKGKKVRKRREALELTLTYEELRNIFRRTAIENIKSVF